MSSAAPVYGREHPKRGDVDLKTGGIYSSSYVAAFYSIPGGPLEAFYDLAVISRAQPLQCFE